MPGMEKEAIVTVFRFDPFEGRPWYQEYRVPGPGATTVMGALFFLSAHAEDPPAFRRFTCNRGQCAGCVMSINGRPRRACTTPLRHGMRLEPLYDYPVIRDLVVDFGRKTAAGDGGYRIVQSGSFVLRSRSRGAKSRQGPWAVLGVDAEPCRECREKPCVQACPVNRIGNLEDRQGIRLGPLSGPIRIVRGRAQAAGACNVCSDRPCREKCPVGAIRAVAGGAGTGIDVRKCIGCGLCVAACPRGNIWLNLERGHAVKCDFCQGEPACLNACPHKAIHFRAVKL